MPTCIIATYELYNKTDQARKLISSWVVHAIGILNSGSLRQPGQTARWLSCSSFLFCCDEVVEESKTEAYPYYLTPQGPRLVKSIPESSVRTK